MASATFVRANGVPDHSLCRLEIDAGSVAAKADHIFDRPRVRLVGLRIAF
jgi:hypothetical protein